MGPVLRHWTFTCTLSRLLQFLLHCTGAALAFVDVGVAFADRAAVVVAVGFSQDLWVLHISICITPEVTSMMIILL